MDFKTPDDVCRSTSGGGAVFVDKNGAKERLQVRFGSERLSSEKKQSRIKIQIEFARIWHYCNTSNSTLYYDADGSGSAQSGVAIAVLTGVTSLNDTKLWLF
jgi:hypothetical protein